MAEWGPYSNIPAIQNKAPTYPKHLDIYVNAYNSLSNDRLNTSGGVGFIPFPSILQYCKWCGIKDQEEFIAIIQEMDREYVSTAHKQQEKQMKKDSKKWQQK